LPNRTSIPFSCYNVLSLSTADMSGASPSKIRPTVSSRRSKHAPPFDTPEIEEVQENVDIAGTKSLKS